MKFTKTATAIAMSALFGIAAAGGALAQGGGSGSGGSGSGGNTNSLTGPSQSMTGPSGTGTNQPAGVTRGTASSSGTDYHWRQKEWWQQHARDGRVTRQQYMDQMSRRWDEIDRSGRGYATPDDLARAFGDETTVAPSGTPRVSGTNDGGRSVDSGTATPPTRSGSSSTTAPR